MQNNCGTRSVQVLFLAYILACIIFDERRIFPFAKEHNNKNKDQFEEISSYLKIDVAIFVHIECTENMVAEFFRIARWEEHFVHVDKFCWR